MGLLVTVVTDRSAADPAWTELQRLLSAVPDARLQLMRVAPRDTVAAAERVAQLSRLRIERVVVHDVATGPGQCLLVGAAAAYELDVSAPRRNDWPQRVAAAVAHAQRRHPHAVVSRVTPT